MRWLFREERDLMGFRTASLLAVSSLYGNPSASLESGNKFVGKAYARLVSSIPYMSDGRTEDDDREAAVEGYLAFAEKFDRMVRESTVGRDKRDERDERDMQEGQHQ